MKLKAVKTSALLSLLFLVVYPTCNWITSLRSDVGTWYFEWERHIPFVPIFIVPYMSIDLFFVAAPLLCSGDEERRTFARRMSFAIVAAGLCFLVFPLRFAFARPVVSGWLGTIFNTFRGFDRPYNLVPSLHITLRTILADTYARHTRGAFRAVSHVWFSLIGLSTLLTYQHHVVDVAGGFVLAAVCFYLFREAPTRLPLTVNKLVGTYYAAGGIACVVLAAACWPWGALLLWPAVALAIVAAAYVGMGPGIFRKRDGRLPLSTRLILGPVLAGQWLSLQYYRRQCHAWDEVAPRVWIGRKLNAHEAAEAARCGVTAVLDLTAEFSEVRPFLGVGYCNLCVMDLTAPTQDQLRRAVAFITEHTVQGIVYVHCKIGYSRSAAIVGAYLLASNRATSAEEAVALMLTARPALIVRPEAMAALRNFAKTV